MLSTIIQNIKNCLTISLLFSLLSGCFESSTVFKSLYFPAYFFNLFLA